MHVFSQTTPTGYDPGVCHEYRGKARGYCGRAATGGLCTEHALQRAGGSDD